SRPRARRPRNKLTATVTGNEKLSGFGSRWRLDGTLSCRRAHRLALRLIAEMQERNEHESKGCGGRGDENERRELVVEGVLEQERADIVGRRRCQVRDRHH